MPEAARDETWKDSGWNKLEEVYREQSEREKRKGKRR